MNLQTNSNYILKTSRVKALESHLEYPYVVAGLYTGEVQLLAVENDELVVKKSVKVAEGPVRAVAFNLKNSQILAGTDEGNIVFLDSENLSINKVLEAHEDFIRSIAVSEGTNQFLTSSDDNTVKLFDLENFTLKMLYKDFKHYVMDVKFDSFDSSIFYTASLDGKIRSFSTFNTKKIDSFYCRPKQGRSVSTKKSIKNAISSLKTTKTISYNTFSNLSGVNSISFINRDCIGSVNDEGYLTVFDKIRKTVVNMIKIHNGQTNKVKKLNENYFATCSNDGTLKVFDEMMKVEASLSSNYKIWDFCLFKENFLIAGTDEELILSKITVEKKIRKMAGGRIFELRDLDLFSIRIDEMAEKHLGTFPDEIIDFIPSPNGKLIAAVGYSNVILYSVLGLRRKFEVVNARDFIFNGEEFLVIKEENVVKFNSKFEEIGCVEVEGIEKILCVKNELLLVLTTENVVLYKNDQIHARFDYAEEGAILKGVLGQFYALLIQNDNLKIYDIEGKELPIDFSSVVYDFIVDEEVLYLNTDSVAYYSFMHENKLLLYPLKKIGEKLLGTFQNSLFYCSEKSEIESLQVDKKFIEFQLQVLRKEEVGNVSDFSIKAISFYESLNLLEEALKLCTNDNQRFEIYLKQKNFEKAFSMASSPAKFSKLGNCFYKEFQRTGDKKYLEKASECFYNGKDLKNLFLTDSLSTKNYLTKVGEMAKKKGQLNLSLLSYFVNKDYEKCSELLKDTIYHKMFVENFINK